MPESKWKRYLPALAVALLMGLALFLRDYEPPGGPLLLLILIRAAIYFALFILWGVSVSQRVIQPQARRLFTAIAVLMVLWMAFRTARFVSQPSVFDRYCWYLYYIPMLYIPLLTALLAARLGRPEGFRLPRWTLGLYVAAGCIAALVLTNDLHHLVFVFPQGGPMDNDVYRYGRGFLIPALWRYGGLLATFLLVFLRSRLPGRGKRLLLPVVPALLLVAYHIGYLLKVLGFPWPKTVGDLTVTECVLVVCILECCLGTGLIPSNSRYEELFRAGIGAGSAVIVDGDYRQRIASGSYSPLPRDILRKAEDAPVILEGGLRLSSAPIQGGRVLWVEDISQLLEITADLADKREYLTEQVVIRQKEVEARRREQALSERNRLYDQVVGEMQGAVTLFSDLIDQLESCEDAGQEALLTAELAVVCTQLKRSVNLVFLQESQGEIDACELSYAVKEWLDSLRLLGTRCAFRSELEAALAFSDALALYAALARLLLAALPGLRTVCIRVQAREGRPLLLLDLCCQADLSGLEGPGLCVEREGEGEWSVELSPEGGTAA